MGVDQSPICVDAQGNLDSTFACAGDAKTLLPNYQSLMFQEDQAGYLAGIVAASVSKTGEIGAIGGTTLCAPCVRYIQGYELGAKSINPDIKVDVAYVTRDFSNAAFQDQPGGKKFADTVPHHQQEGRCAVPGRGADRQRRPRLCLQPQDLGRGRRRRPVPVLPGRGPVPPDERGEAPPGGRVRRDQGDRGGLGAAGDIVYNAANDGIGIAPFYDAASQVPADVTTKVNDALTQMKAGTLKTCPDTGCGVGPS